jgi:ATP synthase protein I
MKTMPGRPEPVPIGPAPERDRFTEDPSDEGLEPDFKPLDAQQAQAWRARQTAVSPWRVLLLQALVGGLVTLLAAVFGGSAVALSAGWGVLSVILPAAVFARALARQMHLRQAGSALVGLLVWEGVKVALTVVLLLVAPQVVKNLDWLALLAGFVVTIKVYWLAWMLAGRRR